MKHILVIDDSKQDLFLLKALLENDYEVTPTPSGEVALKYLEKMKTDLILLDIFMPEMDGFEVLKLIKSNPKTENIPVIFLTGTAEIDMEASCLSKGVDDFVTKPFDPVVLRRRIAHILELYELRYNLELSLAHKSRQLTRMALSSVVTIANTVDAKDKYTGGHSLRVAVCARDIAENLGWSDEECQNIYSVALLHDIGKIAVPDSILNKPGRLDDSEFEEIKKHPVVGNEILRDITVLPHLHEGALMHHERWNGSGYPTGKSGEDIPIYARIIAVADAYDAMNSDRIYRKHLSVEKIISEFNRGRGSQFDPELADLFVFMLKGGYSVDPKIAQNKESSESATHDGGLNLLGSLHLGGEGDNNEELDSLTGLFTRSYLNTRVGNKIVEEHAGALMLIDLDNFHEVKNKFGENASDRILQDFAKLLGSFFRDADVVCRIEQDLFAVFVSGESGKSVIEKKAQLIIDAVSVHDDFARYKDVIGVSIGIALCPENGITFEELYGAADKVLSFIKETEKNTYRCV